MKGNEALRINILFIFVLLFAGVIIYQLFVLGYINHFEYAKTAQNQRDRLDNVLARGNIYVKEDNQSNNLFLAATNKKFPLLQVNPSLIESKDADYLANEVASAIGLDSNNLLQIFKSETNYYKVLARKLSDDQIKKINNLNAKGLSIAYEVDRFYPAGKLAADVIGFLGYNQNGRAGQYGVEAQFNDLLFSDEKNNNKTDKDDSYLGSIKRWLGLGNSEEIESGPVNIVLTIDKNVQNFIENQLDQLIKKYEAEKGTIIVQNPNTGEIIAMADAPTFNPEDYSTFDISLFLNGSTQEMFEPGSSFKPVTMAAGLDLGEISPNTVFTDTGSVEIAGYKIKNFSERVFGTVTMSEVLEKSINTGTMFIENTIGDKAFLDYVINMGFGQVTGIDLPGEISGDITNLYSGRKINYLTASFGQGIAVTPIQLINAYSAIANGGKLMRPYVVAKIIQENGQEIVSEPEIISIPISERTSTKLKTMLTNVVDNGFDKARIKGYDVAGKTGTAQISDKTGGYIEDEYIHDFMGFAPSYDPKFVVLIKIDKPKGVTYASDSLSPTYREIANYLLNYYRVPPTRK